MFKIMQTIDSSIAAVMQLKVSQKTTFPAAGLSPAKLSGISAYTTATLLTLTLLAGCAAINTAQTAPAATSSVVCSADSDDFCVEGNEDSAARLGRRGVEYGEKGELDLALGLFKDAIKLDSSNPEFYYNLGVTYNHKGMPVETEAAYIAGAAIPSSNSQHTINLAKIHFNLACLYALQGKKDAAFEQLEKMFVVDQKLLFHWVEGDADLTSLRDDPRYKQILVKLGAKASSPPEEASKIEGSGKPN